MVKIEGRFGEFNWQVCPRDPHLRHRRARLANQHYDRQYRYIDLGLNTVINRLRRLVAMLFAKIGVFGRGTVAGRDRSQLFAALHCAVTQGCTGVACHRELRKQQQSDGETGDDFSAQAGHSLIL